LPIYCQLSEYPAIQGADNYKENYTDRESVFASFSSQQRAKIRV
jgi:hypothetical protein